MEITVQILRQYRYQQNSETMLSFAMIRRARMDRFFTHAHKYCQFTNDTSVERVCLFVCLLLLRTPLGFR